MLPGREPCTGPPVATPRTGVSLTPLSPPPYTHPPSPLVSSVHHLLPLTPLAPGRVWEEEEVPVLVVVVGGVPGRRGEEERRVVSGPV